MTPLTGLFTLKVVTNEQVVNTMQLDILPDHIVNCPQLGESGRYNERRLNGKDGYILMSFGDTSNFNGPTSFSIFAKIDFASQSFAGVMLDHISGQRFGCEARTSEFQADLNFGPFMPLPTWPGNEFTGTENPGDVHSYYRFDYEGSQIGKASIGVIGQPEAWTGPSASVIYPSNNEELLVFGTNRLVTYGAVVDRSNSDIQLKEGMYINPFSGGGYYGTWEASLKAVSA